MRDLISTAQLLSLSLLLALPATSKTLLVANKASLSLSFIDESTMRELFALPIGQSPNDTPHEVAVSPDAKWALVSHYGEVSFNFVKFEFDNLRHPGSHLSLIDVQQGALARRFDLPLGSSPHGIQFLSDTKALVTAEGIQSLLLVDFTDGNSYQVQFFPIPGQGAHELVIDADKKYAYVANKDSGSVVKFDLIHNEAVGESVIGKHAEGIALSGDGAFVMVTDRLSNSLNFLNANTLELQTKLATEGGPIRVTLYDNGKSALLTNVLSGTAQRVAIASRQISPGFNTTNTWSATTGKPCQSFFGLLKVPVNMLVRDDQQTAFIANSYAGNITLVDIKAGRVLNTFQAGKEPDGMAISALDLRQIKKDRRSGL